MPIYEYRCKTCGALLSRLSRRTDDAASVACDSCGAQAERVISSFALHRSLQTQIDQLDPRFEKQLDAVDTSRLPPFTGGVRD